jgi:hypothetical protein
MKRRSRIFALFFAANASTPLGSIRSPYATK